MTEAVVLIHGLGGSARSFDRLAPLLERRFRVLAPDLPGFGGTPSPADGDYSMPAFAAHVRGVLADAGVTDVKVVGHSMGGSIAVALAEAEPGLVRRLVLVNAPPSVESRLTARSGSERLIRMPVVGRVAWALANDSRRRAGLESSMAPGHPVPDQFVADLKATTHAAFAGSTIAIDRYLGERTLPDRVARLRDTPVAVVQGELDQRIDPSALAGYAGLPNVKVTHVHGAGHSPIWEMPEAVAAAV